MTISEYLKNLFGGLGIVFFLLTFILGFIAEARGPKWEDLDFFRFIALSVACSLISMAFREH